MPGAEPIPSSAPDSRRAEILVQPELLARHVVEAAEVDVVHACRERAAHHRNVEAVVRSVDDDTEQPSRPRGDRIRIGCVERLIPSRRASRRTNGAPHSSKKLDDAAADRPGGSDDGDQAPQYRYFRSARISSAARSPVSTAPFR